MSQRSQNIRDENDNEGWNVCKSKKVTSDKLSNSQQLQLKQQQQQQQQPQPVLIVDTKEQAKKSRTDSESQVVEENQFIVVEKYKRIESQQQQQQQYESEFTTVSNPKIKDTLQQSYTPTITTTTGMTPTEKFKQFRERLNDQTKRDYYFDRQFFKIHNCPQINGLDCKLIDDLSDENSSIFQKTRNIILSYLNYNGGIIFFGLSSIYRDGLPHMEVRGFDITQQNRKCYDKLNQAINIISSRIYPKQFKIDVSIMKVQKDTHRKTVPINKFIARIVVQQGADLQNLYVYRETASSPDFIAAKYSKKDSSFVTIKGTGVGNVLELKLQLAKVKDLTIKHTDDFIDRKDSFSYLKGKFSQGSDDQDYSDEGSFYSSMEEKDSLSEYSEDQVSTQERDSIQNNTKQSEEQQESSSSTNNNHNNSSIQNTLDVSSTNVGGWKAEIPIDTKVPKNATNILSNKTYNSSNLKMNDSPQDNYSKQQNNISKPNIPGGDSSSNNGTSNILNEPLSNLNHIQGDQVQDQPQNKYYNIHQQNNQQGSYIQSDLLPQFLKTELQNGCNETNLITQLPQNIQKPQHNNVNPFVTHQFNQYQRISNQTVNSELYQNTFIQSYNNIQYQQPFGQQNYPQQPIQRISSSHSSQPGQVYQPNNNSNTITSSLLSLSDNQLKDLQRHLENQVQSFQDYLTFAQIEQQKRLSQRARGISNGLLGQQVFNNGTIGQQYLQQSNVSK